MMQKLHSLIITIIIIILIIITICYYVIVALLRIAAGYHMSILNIQMYTESDGIVNGTALI